MVFQLEEFLPDFKVANAVIHFDEASPHMHVVGVPIWEGVKKGLAKKVSKRNVFTPENLSVILQDKLREEAGSCFKFNVKEELAEKKRGRNHDLTVVEYKVAKEEERLEELQQEIFDVDNELFTSKIAYRQVQRANEDELREIKQEISEKQSENLRLDYAISYKRDKLEEYEDEISKWEQFKNTLITLKNYISSYLPLSPLIEEYANCVEQRKDIEVGNSFRGLLNALGEFLKAFKELIIDGICWFPRLMRWQTSKGEVVPVFSDYRNEGYDYHLKVYMNVVTKERYSIEIIREEIKPENRIGTLEQLEQGIMAAEEMVREMERTRILGR